MHKLTYNVNPPRMVLGVAAIDVVYSLFAFLLRGVNEKVEEASKEQQNIAFVNSNDKAVCVSVDHWSI